jgi:hypothetical protein
VGQVKLRQYGDAFLEVIKSYCEKAWPGRKAKGNGRDKSDRTAAISSSVKRTMPGKRYKV